MKNASLIMNLVLTAAVCVLFYLHFFGKKNVDARVASFPTKQSIASNGDCRIAYFEMDSINNSFVLNKNVKAAKYLKVLFFISVYGQNCFTEQRFDGFGAGFAHILG